MTKPETEWVLVDRLALELWRDYFKAEAAKVHHPVQCVEAAHAKSITAMLLASPPAPVVESTLARIQRTPTYVIAREFDELTAQLAAQAKRIEALLSRAETECDRADAAEATVTELRGEVATLKAAQVIVRPDEVVCRIADLDRMEARATTAEKALRKLAIVQVHRPGHDKTTVHVGWACKACGCDAEMPVIGGICSSPDHIPHSPDCPLAALPSPPITKIKGEG